MVDIRKMSKEELEAYYPQEEVEVEIYKPITLPFLVKWLVIMLAQVELRVESKRISRWKNSLLERFSKEVDVADVATRIQLDPDLGRLIEEAEPLDLKPIGWLQHAINRFFLFGVLWRIRIKNWMRR